MRGFLLFLALACPLVVMSPSFWALFAMGYGAQPVTYRYHDGSTQEALLGPAAPWPDWAIRPDGARLVVRSWFGPSATSSSTGQGALDVKGPWRDTAAAFIARLQDAGWSVASGLFRASLPEIPPRMLVTCRVRARLGVREIHASFDLAPDPGVGTLAWSDGPPPPAWNNPAIAHLDPC